MSKEKNITAAESTPKKRERRENRVFTGQEKSEAVLSIWSERRKPSEICRELSINWAVLNQWQNQAMKGMIAALEPKRGNKEERGPALGPKLEKLLEKAGQRVSKISKLEKRLEMIQSDAKSQL